MNVRDLLVEEGLEIIEKRKHLVQVFGEFAFPILKMSISHVLLLRVLVKKLLLCKF